MAFGADERGNDVAELAGGRFAILLDILVALFADRRSASFAGLLELGPAVGALYDRERPATVLEKMGKRK